MGSELEAHKIELEMQNAELRKAEASLAASRAQYFDLFEHAPVGYVDLDSKSLIRSANLMAASMLGLPQRILVGKFLSAFMTLSDADILYLQIREANTVN